jgi:hypothetical protein
VGHVQTDQPGERDEWELHADQDELLYLGVAGQSGRTLAWTQRQRSSAVASAPVRWMPKALS